MSKKVSVSLSPERVSLSPGDTAEFVATIHNASDVVEAYTVDVQGIDPAWSKLSVTSLSLFPGDKETVRIQVTPPVSSSAKAGSYPVSVRVISKRDPAIGTIASFILDLGKISDYELDISPKRTRGRKGPFQLAITNNGNTVSTYKLEAFDPEDICEFRFKSDTVAVDPGTTKKVPMVVNPRKKPFTGSSRRFSFSAKATPLEGEPKEVEGELECRVLMPRWGILAICIGIVAVVALIVVLALVSSKTPVLPIDETFVLAAGKTRSFVFQERQEKQIQATVTCHGACRLSLILVGPDGKERQRDEQAPFVVTYAISESDLRSGAKWTLWIANLSDVAEVTVDVEVSAT